ncbi:DMT family transporter [Actinomycetospora aeridis]|uniref:SMR family transporter n=1 Tax=Actinomycetospora aeridis TaxID=3129231 RepID=A0ABU8NB90_9PSEU
MHRIRGLVLLAATIVCEVLGTLALPASEGFTRVPGTVGVLLGYAAAIILFSRALDHGLPLGIAYATVTGCGLVSATAVSAVLLDEPVTAPQGLGLVLILGGALLLQRRAVPS